MSNVPSTPGSLPAAPTGAGAPEAPASIAATTGSFLAELRSSERAEHGPAVAPPKRRRRIPLHLLVCLGVMTIGCAALMGMRQMGMKAGMTFETDAALLPVDNGGSKNTQRLVTVMADLEHSQSPDAFAYKRPDKNPFSLAAVAAKPTEQTADPGKEMAERQAEERRRRQEQLENSLASMQLNGIVGGRGGAYIASIGNKTYRIGDVVDELFTITEIDGRSVTVAADEQLYELTVGSQAAKPVAKKPGKPATKPGSKPAAKPSK